MRGAVRSQLAGDSRQDRRAAREAARTASLLATVDRLMTAWREPVEDQQPRESAFAKACSYLNFSPAARWGAHLSGAGVGVVAVVLLGVLWLFADLMVWRGRVPDFNDLPPMQQRRFSARYDRH